MLLDPFEIWAPIDGRLARQRGSRGRAVIVTLPREAVSSVTADEDAVEKREWRSDGYLG